MLSQAPPEPGSWVGALQVCVLASGSSGNCTLVRTPTTCVLIDAGLSAKETARRMEAVGLTPDQLQGILVSHEHGDHTAGLRVLHRKHGVACYANHGTLEALSRSPAIAGISWSLFSTGSPFTVGDLTIEPFSVPHDAYEPVGFLVHTQGLKAGIMTDAGIVTNLLRERLAGCQLLVVESNHDEGMLQDAERPWHLKQRIRGRQGHLSNFEAAGLIAEVAGPQLQRVYLAHLSEDCNREHIALRTVREALDRKGFPGVDVEMTYPDRISAVWTGV